MMKKLLAMLMAAALLLCGAALADTLPSFGSSSDAGQFPDPGTYVGAEAQLFQLDFRYNGIDYDTYEYALPSDIAVFLADWQAALLANGFEATLGFEQGNNAVFFSNDDVQGFLLYGYQGRMLLMIPSEYGFVPEGQEPEAPIEEAPAEAPAEEAPAEAPAEEAPAEAPAEEAPAEAPAEPEAPAETEAEAPAEPEPEAPAEPVGDLSSDQVAEFDPTEGEIPFEYLMEQEELAAPEAPAEPETSAEETPAEAPAEAPAEEAPAETPASSVAAPDNLGAQVLAVVPFGQSYTYETQIWADGSARLDASEDAYETLSFTQTLKEYMLPDDFADRYGAVYRLSGDEAGASFDLVLNDYSGEAEIIPQNVIDVAFCSASGNAIDRGFQLMDSEISGGFDVALAPGEVKTLYKRYAWSGEVEPMQFLVISVFNDGQEQLILFDLTGARPGEQSQDEGGSEPETEAEPAVVYADLSKGDRSEAVKALQEKLVALGYLDDRADGIFGKNTEKAVKAAQEAFGMEQTGVADDALQQKLFSEGA